MNSLRDRLSNLTYDFASQGNLGPTSQKQDVTSEDYMSLMGLSFTADLFSKADNKEGVDLDPAPNQVRLTPESLAKLDGDSAKRAVPGEEIVGEYTIRDTPKGKFVSASAESIDSKGHLAWSLHTSADFCTIVALEDKGETFQATAIRFGSEEKDNLKFVRTGSWTELPDALCFSGPMG